MGGVKLTRDGISRIVKLRLDVSDPNRPRAYVDIEDAAGNNEATPWAIHLNDSGARATAEFFGCSGSTCVIDAATGYITEG